MELGIPLIIIAVVLFVVGVVLRRARPSPEQAARPSRRAARVEQQETEEIDLSHPRPKVVTMHVHGNEARVTFDVPVPDGEDEVLAELLVHEAVEVIREKRHTLPLDDVTAVVALAGRGDKVREMGRANLATPGQLPPRSAMPSLLNLSHIAADPLEADLDAGPVDVPTIAAPSPRDQLPPLRSEIRLPKAVETGLRAQGTDPDTMTPGELVTGMLSLVGYQVTPGLADQTYTATKGGQTTFIREDPYQPGEYPEVDAATIRRFLIEFQGASTDRGLFVSDKFGPFEIYETERREPRVRFVTRERLQKLVDGLALT